MKRYLKYGGIYFLPCLLLFGLVTFTVEKIVINQRNSFSSYWLGKTFQEKFYNSSGNPQPVDLSTKFTIIDFWFVGCAPCIKEMKEFDEFLRANPQLKIYSVSIDKFSLWRDLTSEAPTHTQDQFKFLSKPFPNWIHLSVYQNDSVKNSSDILNSLHIDTFPTYLILDKQGEVVEIKHSLVSTPSMSFEVNKSGFIEYFGDFFQSGTKNIIKIIRAFCILYFILYTIVFVLVKAFRKLRNQKLAQKSVSNGVGPS